MNFLLLVAVPLLVLLQVSDIQSHPHPELYNECAKGLGISDDMLKGKPEDNNGKPEFKCVALCVLKKVGELDSGNKINLIKVRENAYPKDKVEDIVGYFKDCSETVKSDQDECEYANAVKDCLREKFPPNRKDF